MPSLPCQTRHQRTVTLPPTVCSSDCELPETLKLLVMALETGGVWGAPPQPGFEINSNNARVANTSRERRRFIDIIRRSGMENIHAAKPGNDSRAEAWVLL